MPQEQAAAVLGAAPKSFPARLWSKPARPKRVELVYLPYYFFDIEVSQEGHSQVVGVAVDGVLATAVFFVSDSLTREPPAAGTVCDFAESPDAARQTALGEYRSLLLEHGLRSRRTLSVEDISAPEQVHYPFWVAYFEKRGSYDFKALDAVSGEVQGVRMRKVFLAAFRKMTPPR